MNRYISSFIISAIFYLLIAILFFYIFTQSSWSDKDREVEDVKKVSFSIVAQKCKPKIEKNSKPKPVKQKPKPKPIPAPKIIEPEPVPEPIEEKVEPRIIEPEPVPEPIEEKNEPKIIEPEPVPEPEPVEEKPLSDFEPVEEKSVPQEIENQTVINDMIEAKKKLFIEDLVKRINSNKSYPRTARRRSIQGVVEIEFIIHSDGNVKDIKIIYGKNIFKKSAVEAIRYSFPLDVDGTLFSFPKKFKINIEYILK